MEVGWKTTLEQHTKQERRKMKVKLVLGTLIICFLVSSLWILPSEEEDQVLAESLDTTTTIAMEASNQQSAQDITHHFPTKTWLAALLASWRFLV
eukprot:m.54760 g.54760  ORF g.54760 m.54760 type:complete len:95 (-) comp11447_c0_seq2:146-430(-)